MKKTLTAIITIIIMLSQAFPLAWAWQIERPHHNVDILDFVENSNTNNEASVGLGVSIDKYIENFQDYGGADFINMNVSMTANSRILKKRDTQTQARSEPNISVREVAHPVDSRNLQHGARAHMNQE